MIEPTFRTLLVPAIRAAPLTAPGLVTAGEAAIALSAIAVRAKKEHRATFAAQANSLPENDLSLTRHAPSQAGLDNDNRCVSGWNQLEGGGLTKVAIAEPRRFQRRGSFLLPAFEAKLHDCLMIGRMIAPSAR
jgi:hypothetical protein